MNHLKPLPWSPITDLPADWKTMASTELPALVRVWKEQTAELQRSSAFKEFNERLRRKIAIETGVIERLYTIDRGITQLLIEQGIDAALIPHGATDKPAEEVVALIRDHETAIDWLFEFVANQRSLSTSFIKELHQLLTRNQHDTEAIDQFRRRFRVGLERGVWKKQPNNPLRPDGEIHEYCPPIHVDAEMDNLVRWHLEHLQLDVPPEIEAAWLHHRFTQIHPFQDGNGRVARCLASLVLIRAGWFPLTVTRIDRSSDDVNRDRLRYIESLEKADYGDLKSLIDLFVERQRQAFVSALGLSELVRAEGATPSAIISSVASSFAALRTRQLAESRSIVERYASELYDLATEYFDEIAKEIRIQLSGVIRHTVTPRHRLDQAETRAYNRFQVIEIAKSFDYFANLGYHSWIALPIRVGESNTESYAEILVSIHIPGKEYIGLLVCTACAYWKDPSEEGGSSLIRDITSLSDSPFSLSYADDLPGLKRSFKQWLEQVMIAGLDFWRKGL